MKLYELNKGDYFKITDEELRTPVGHDEVNTNEVFWFGHIDGMYSFCKDKDKNIVHFAAWTEVEVVDGMEMSATTST